MSAAEFRSLEKRLENVSGENLEVRISSESPHFDDIKSFIREKQFHISLIEGLGI